PDLTPETRRDNTRNMQLATLDVGGSKLHVANHHAHWVMSPVGDEVSVEKMQLVAQKVRGLEGPVIVAGDLNVTAASPAMRVFDGLLTDLTATHDIPDTLSELGKVRNVPCDHILVNDQVKVNSFAVRDDLVSDHKTLVMEFEL
ncbi:MAG TPA: endonuclease/exonuclease/phosphatase family protein, partial [Candidatus Saccharimonadales bacterium]|nr:endonuclease/exonuclease/phosphatase family protein [Candidatus Saccharimonadales bacterium]